MREPKSRTLPALLQEIADRDPDRTALVSDGESVSYGALARRSDQWASRFEKAGLAAGDRIATLADNRRDWLEWLFAATACGATVVPFSTWSTRSELDYLVEDSGVRWILAIEALGERDFRGDLEELRSSPAGASLDRVIYPDSCSELDGVRASAPSRARPEDPLVVLYTSGSSARPKAVPLCHGAAIENGFQIGERMGLRPSDVVFVPVPLFWSFGCINALPAILTHGATMVLQGIFEPAGALDLIEKHGCTALYTLPAITNALTSLPSFAPERTSGLRTGLTIGTPEDVRRAARELGAGSICNIYGSTETYGNCAVTPHDWPLERRMACQGPPLPGATIRIRDPRSGALCESDAVGEIEVGGRLTPGYAGASREHNARVFTDDGFFRTGDLGFLDGRGALHFEGRSHEMIKRSGINVSPAEVEEAILRHPGVASVGVTGTPDPRWDEAIVAFVVPARGIELDLAALFAHCRGLLSRYKLPDHIEVCGELPLTPTGKLMRRELRRNAEELERA